MTLGRHAYRNMTLSARTVKKMTLSHFYAKKLLVVRLPYCCGGRSEGDGRSQLPGLVHVHVRVLAPAHRGPRAIAMAALVLPHHLERHLIFMRAASLV